MPVVIRDGPRFTLPTGRDVTWRRCAAFDRLVASSPTCPHATRPHLYALYLAVCRPSQATVIYQSLCLKSASSSGSPGGERDTLQPNDSFKAFGIFELPAALASSMARGFVASSSA